MEYSVFERSDLEKLHMQIYTQCAVTNSAMEWMIEEGETEEQKKIGRNRLAYVILLWKYATAPIAYMNIR